MMWDFILNSKKLSSLFLILQNGKLEENIYISLGVLLSTK
jgi:hypothetical protein